MCEINKDYISVVRNKGGLLHFERVPIIRSEKLTSQLMCMSCDDSYTLEEMDCVLKNDPLFSQIMIPYWDLQYLEDKSEIEPYNCLMLSALEGYECIKTKPELFKKAVEIIQLVDYKWTLMKIMLDNSNVIICSPIEGETTNISIQLTNDSSITLNSLKIGKDGKLSITVKHKGKYVAPYLSLVKLYECSFETLRYTLMLDSDLTQWDYALLSFVKIANEIITNEFDYFQKNVVDSACEMLDAMKWLKEDIYDFYCWQEKYLDDIVIYYSGNAKEAPEEYSWGENELMDSILKAKKIYGGIKLGQNLSEWAELGGQFEKVRHIESEIIQIAKYVLDELDLLIGKEGILYSQSLSTKHVILLNELNEMIKELHYYLDEDEGLQN